MRRMFSATSGKREYREKVQTFWMKTVGGELAAAGKPPFDHRWDRRRPASIGGSVASPEPAGARRSRNFRRFSGNYTGASGRIGEGASSTPIGSPSRTIPPATT